MGSGRANRFINTKNSSDAIRRQGATGNVKPIQDIQTGFICHPRGVPIEVRRKWFARPSEAANKQSGQIGIMFDSPLYYRPGTVIELTIPVREKIEKFTGTVVLIRNHQDHFETGLWLNQGDDASRARIVEQICHIDAYMKEKKYREGPYNLNPERVASEWIAKYAAGVPMLQDPGKQTI